MEIRASQINGCAPCLHMHTEDALKSGEDPARLYILSAWRESSLFSGRERAALAWTEAVTKLSETGAPDSDYAAVADQFSEKEQVMLTLMIGAINSFNKTQRRPPHPCHAGRREEGGVTAIAPSSEAAAVFDPLRPRLMRIAYRMLGSIADAEDVVQEAFIRWQAADRTAVRVPEAFLRRVVTRLCLDELKSAHARRETYVGPWLPEPLVEAEDEADDVTLPLMMALERLSPLERAAFLLHDVFDVAFADVAETIGRDEATCRQLAKRARDHLKQARPRYSLPKERGFEIAQAFFNASHNGDMAALQALLTDDIAIYTDGGGKRPAALVPAVGYRTRHGSVQADRGGVCGQARAAAHFPHHQRAAWLRDDGVRRSTADDGVRHTRRQDRRRLCRSQSRQAAPPGQVRAALKWLYRRKRPIGCGDRGGCRDTYRKDRNMTILLMVLIVLHVVPGVFWAGPTFALAVVAMEVVHPGLGSKAVVAKPNSLLVEPRMNVHKNARMTVRGRALLVERINSDGWPVAQAALAAGVSERTAYKWLARYRSGGELALHDRHSTPLRSPHRTPVAVTTQIEGLRRQRLSGPRIARRLGLPVSTVGAVLRRRGLGCLKQLDERPEVVRYERAKPGELIHIDTKKLGRIDGLGHRITGDRTRRKRGLAGSTSTSPSTTARGWPTPSCCRPRPVKPAPASSPAPANGSPPTA